MKPSSLISAILIALTSIAFAQSGLTSKDDLVRKWGGQGATRSLNAASTPPAVKGIRKTTAPSVIVENYKRVATSTTRGISDATRGIEVVPVSSQQVEVSVAVDQNSAQSFNNILFKIDRDEFLDDTSRQQVKIIAEAMKSVSGATFLVEGHTCDLGEASHNKTLSDKRAARIVTELKALGVGAERLLPLGFGKTSPAVENNNESNRQKNRRVTIYKRA